MEEIPASWGNYARLQQQAMKTTSMRSSIALDAALGFIHQPNFSQAALHEVDFERLAESAARKERDHASIFRRVMGSALGDNGSFSEGAVLGPGAFAPAPDDTVHARRELERLMKTVPLEQLELMAEAGDGTTYQELAQQLGSTPGAIKTKVHRMRSRYH